MSAARSAGDRPRAAVTIGVFDGVHRGHAALVERALEEARVIGEAVGFTFSTHPLAVLNPALCPPSLTTAAERQELLLAAGLDHVHVIDFDRSLAGTEARVFIEAMILSRYDLQVLVAGPDFAMGRDRRGDLGTLERIGSEAGFRLITAPPVPAGGAPISSTRIRTLIRQGLVEEAEPLLGRPYFLRGVVVTGDGRGRGLGFPTANLAVPAERLLPQPGVYAVSCRLEGRAGIYPAVVNVGVAPTFGGSTTRVEAHLIDWSGELVDSRLEVRFHRFIRAERRFESVDALVSQIDTDRLRAADILAKLDFGSTAQGADAS